MQKYFEQARKVVPPILPYDDEVCAAWETETKRMECVARISGNSGHFAIKLYSQGLLYKVSDGHNLNSVTQEIKHIITTYHSQGELFMPHANSENRTIN